MLPADQHLTAADLFLERAELRLDVELEFMIFNGVLEGFIQHIFTLHLFFKRIVKEAALACLGLSPACFARSMRTINSSSECWIRYAPGCEAGAGGERPRWKLLFQLLEHG